MSTMRSQCRANSPGLSQTGCTITKRYTMKTEPSCKMNTKIKISKASTSDLILIQTPNGWSRILRRISPRGPWNIMWISIGELIKIPNKLNLRNNKKNVLLSQCSRLILIKLARSWLLIKMARGITQGRQLRSPRNKLRIIRGSIILWSHLRKVHLRPWARTQSPTAPNNLKTSNLAKMDQVQTWWPTTRVHRWTRCNNSRTHLR